MSVDFSRAAGVRRVFLIGPMGAGKTTIGGQLAQVLSLPFYDSDKEIEKRTGVTIPLIFELEGEEGFRRREVAVIDELTQFDNLVLATGGGAVLRPENRQRLRSRGYVVYLHAPIDQLVKRTSRDRTRPLLQNVDPRQQMIDIMAIREPLYREVADLVLETDEEGVREIVAKILAAMEAR